MTPFPRLALGFTVAGLLVASASFAAPQSQSSSQTPAPTQSQQQPAAQQKCGSSQTSSSQQPSSTASSTSSATPSAPCSSQSQTQSPSSTSTTTQTPAPAQPAPPQPTPAAQSQQTPQDQPVPQKDTVTPKNSKEDVNDIGNRDLGKGINFYSIEREIALGKQLAQEVERSSKMIDDPVVTEYVNRVGQNLVRNSDAKIPFTIKVIDSDQVNAFALPGGFFYVYSGLILRAQEESELAGVMAHEMSHVILRHGTKNATKGEIMQLATIPAMIFLPYGWAGYAAYEGMNMAIPITYLKFSRDDERQADYFGLQYMYHAGYDPNSYITFFERIEADEKRRPGTVAKVFSDHPPTAERIKLCQKEIADILPARPEYIVTTSEFDAVRARLRNIMFARRASDNAPGKPTLRSKTAQSKQGTSNNPNSTTSDDDDRPTLKRLPDDQP